LRDNPVRGIETHDSQRIRQQAGLFAAIVNENVGIALSTPDAGAVDGRDLGETLAGFGQDLMNVYMSPPVPGIYRTSSPRPTASPNW
jgi:hypothetical protein